MKNGFSGYVEDGFMRAGCIYISARTDDVGVRGDKLDYIVNRSIDGIAASGMPVNRLKCVPDCVMNF